MNETKDKSYEWSSKVILLAEDTDTSVMYYQAALRKTKAELIWAPDGLEALKIAQSDQQIDVILMDINMPNLNGIEATREIKKIRPELPIIIQTAYVLSDEKKRSIDAGCDEFLTKPVNISQLLTTLDQLL